ncbi:hypothetical protein GCM10011500_32750 [Mucilaginibacter rubeus]|nr:hypothetical protein GCM10011500_32750 [Mucilaginibacter rubeus]
MATSIIIAHNHPSGELQPSLEDYEGTKRLMNAARLIDIGVLDHLIINRNGYYSIIENCNI